MNEGMAPASSYASRLADLSTIRLPQSYLPGSDRVAKAVLRNDKVVDVVSLALCGAPAGSYELARTEWPDGSRSDTVYRPRPSAPASARSIVIEVQHTVTAASMNMAIRYAQQAYQVYGHMPHVLIFCVAGVSPQSLLRTYQNKDKSWIFDVPCDFWATSCSVVYSKDWDDHHLIDAASDNPLLTVGAFFGQQQESLATHTMAQNPLIQDLYELAHEEACTDTDYCSNFYAALDVVSANVRSVFEKAVATLEDSSKPASATKMILDQGIRYVDKVRQKYAPATEEEEDLQLIEPDYTQAICRRSLSPTDLSDMRLDYDFVLKYRNDIARSGNKRGMDWHGCLAAGHASSPKRFRQFTQPNSLRNAIPRYKQALNL